MRVSEFWNSHEFPRVLECCSEHWAPSSPLCAQESLLGFRRVTDPPCNVPTAGHVGGLGKTVHREFAEASGNLMKDEFIALLTETLVNAAARLRDGAVAYVAWIGAIWANRSTRAVPVPFVYLWFNRAR